MYMQFIFRADLAHLAQSIHPLLIGLISTLSIKLNFRRTLKRVYFTTLAVTLFSVGVVSPTISR